MTNKLINKFKTLIYKLLSVSYINHTAAPDIIKWKDEKGDVTEVLIIFN
jgi:hypothetical protein